MCRRARKQEKLLLSMLSDIFKSEKLGFFFNKIIAIVTKISGVSNHIDDQNKVLYEMAREYPQRIVNTYWTNPLYVEIFYLMNED